MGLAAGAGADTQTYRYDAQGRLVGTTSGQGTETYAYDKANNRTSKRTSGSDVTPDGFSLGVPVGGAEPSTWYASNAVVPGGYDAPTPVSISGGQYRIAGGVWTTGGGTLSPGQSVQVQVQSSGSTQGTAGATLTVGGTSAGFTVVTKAYDTTPDGFSLGVPVGGAEPSTWYASNAVVPGGYDAPAPVSISGGQYRMAGGAWTTGGATLSPGQSVQVQVLSSSSYSTGVSATLTVGGTSSTFGVTTKAPPALQITLYSPGFQVSSNATRAILMSELAATNGASATITGFAPSCGSAAVAGDGQSVAYSAPSVATVFACPGAPATPNRSYCSASFSVRNNGTGGVSSSTASIEAVGAVGTLPPRLCKQ